MTTPNTGLLALAVAAASLKGKSASDHLYLRSPSQRGRLILKSLPYRRQGPGRNEPCWCGSGLKFKKCHRGG